MKLTHVFSTVVLTGILVNVPNCQAQSDQLDPTFIPPAIGGGLISALAVQPDGQILIAGSFASVNGVARNGVARLNGDGTLDGRFDPGSEDFQSGSVLAFQSDGKVLVGGWALAGEVGRLFGDGRRDTNFVSGLGTNDNAICLAIQEDGKILVGGYNYDPRQSTFSRRLVRLNTSGALDAGFATVVGLSPGSVRALALQANGRVLYGGAFGAGEADTAIYRTHTNGATDASFQATTTLTVPEQGNVANRVSSICVYSNKTLIAGRFNRVNNAWRTNMAQLNIDGSTDLGFEPPTMAKDGFSTEVFTAKVQSDGKIIVGGAFTTVSGTNRAYLARLHDDGGFDESFNPVLGAEGLVDPGVRSLALQSDGNLLVLGRFNSANGMSVSGLIRLGPPRSLYLLADGEFHVNGPVIRRGLTELTLKETFPGGAVLYTLDGTDPAVSGTLYNGPLTVRKTRLLRTIAYNADFTQSIPGDPVSVVILPALTCLTDGGGSVAIDPPAGDYFSNALAVVTATPAPGWTFLQWLGDATGTNPVVNLTMTRNKSARAVFGTALNTAAVGGGSIIVRPVSPLHPYGSEVRLTALPGTGNYLAFWANAASGQTNNPLLFVVANADPTVTAVFSSLGGSQSNALTVIPNGRGQVTMTPSGNRFRLNTNVVLQAIAEPGQEFLGWLGAATGSQNPLVVTMNSNKVIAAAFTQRPLLQGEGNPDLLKQDGFRLTVTGEFGGVYEIHGAADWSGWTPLGTVTNTWGTVQFTDPAGTNQTRRFYRALFLP